MAEEFVIRTDGLTKRFGGKTAVDDLSCAGTSVAREGSRPWPVICEEARGCG